MHRKSLLNGVLHSQMACWLHFIKTENEGAALATLKLRHPIRKDLSWLLAHMEP